MIYTITLNPAVDVILTFNEQIKEGSVNRAVSEVITAGGKGVNVSRILKTLGRDSVAIGFVGGLSGKFVEEELERLNIKTDFAYVKNPTRLNIKIAGPKCTELNSPSSTISKEDILNILKKLAKIKKGDVVIVSGSIPKSIPYSTFEQCLKFLANKHVYTIIDMAGTQLLRTLKYSPTLIKPNREELKEALYIDVKTDEDIIKGAKRLIKMGAKNVVVSLGKDGAIFVNNEVVKKVKAPDDKVVNPSGAGDSFIAGFVDEYLRSFDYEKALKQGVIVGTATACSISLADLKKIKEVSKLLK